jgi:hypothetical protein
MHIRRIQYARVPKIRMLNHNFRDDRNHLVVTMDVEGYDPPQTNGFLTIYRALARLFPTLSDHSCCEEWENTPLYLQETQGVSMKWVGEVADVAHLVEHVIVDLQCAVTSMSRCSGVTCGHRDPENRFDLFVECDDPYVGAFSAHFATFLVASMFAKPRLSPHYRDIVQAAHWAHTQPGRIDRAELAAALAMCPIRAQWAISALERFEFFNGNSRGHDELRR